jgi:hypothetical protein
MNFEKELLQVAETYRAEGYRVTVHPQPAQLPLFAADLGADILASRDGQNVLVLVKERRTDLAAIPDLPRRADSLNSQPGWRLDVVVLGSESPIERAVHNAAEPTAEQINQLLDRAEKSVEAGLLDMACVYAWAALEAAMRQISSAAGLYGRAAPNELLAALYSNGFLSREEFDRLREAFRIRTQLVHGFVPQAIDPALIADVIVSARKLVNGRELAEVSAAG